MTPEEQRAFQWENEVYDVILAHVKRNWKPRPQERNFAEVGSRELASRIRVVAESVPRDALRTELLALLGSRSKNSWVGSFLSTRGIRISLVDQMMEALPPIKITPCPEFNPMVNEIIVGKRPRPEVIAELDNHIDNCPQCRAYREQCNG